MSVVGATGKFVGVILLVVVFAQRSAGATVSPGQSATLEWTQVASPLVSGYDVYYGPSSGHYTNHIQVGAVSNATVSGLVAGATYYFAITTRNGAGTQGSYSSQISYAVPRTTTPAIQALRPPAPEPAAEPAPEPALEINYSTKILTISTTTVLTSAWVLQLSTNLANWQTVATGSNKAVSYTVQPGEAKSLFFQVTNP